MSNTEEAWVVNRDGWSKGEWDNEPDKLQFRTNNGMPALIVRNHAGALCGYVGVPKGHPLYEVHYDEAPVEVHGGLTFSNKCHGAICHVPEPGEPDDVWWLGFDCYHAGDYAPTMNKYPTLYADLATGRAGVYRDLAYVKEQCERLSEQL